MGVDALNLVLNFTDLAGIVDSIEPVQPFTPVSNYFGSEGAAATDGVIAVTGARALAEGVVGLTEKGVAKVAGMRGAAVSDDAGNVIILSKSKFGHTFTSHGEDATEFLMKRAAGSGKPMGQFLDNQAAAKLIQDNLVKLKNGPMSVPSPKGFPARMIMPDGTFPQHRLYVLYQVVKA
ncbi:hypothetical protein [Gallaecimonas pentaromativorans]|uniref:Uncharacterized protein n=1 Tax=Gallaecimonas pentaromativorans TaxID=584787 RepID=A0A3N1PJA7_9GAMM|nr:hypothetical protein [Gallaecimonas pentaromativorans]ROQ28725.1 hypothetical protein EDC28_103319 [Gallaecimonas pentaromativorans]